MEMSYVLGFLYADGHLEDSPYIRGKYVRVINTDRDRIELIKSLLRARHPIYIRDGIGNHKQAFLLRIGSHTLYNRLHNFGMTPRKSMTMRFPKMPPRYLAAFIRGYFDGDGCVYLERYPNNGNSRPAKRMRTIFTSGSRDFLASLSRILQVYAKIEEPFLHSHTKKGSFQLRLSSAGSAQLFAFMYSGALPGLYLKRKYDIFRQYFRERPEWIDRKVGRALKSIE